MAADAPQGGRPGRSSATTADSARAREDPGAARTRLERTIEERVRAGGPADDLRLELAAALLDGSDPAAALSCLDECSTEAGRSSASALLTRGCACRLLGRLDEAAAHLAAARAAAEAARDAARAVRAAVMLSSVESLQGFHDAALGRLRSTLLEAVGPDLRRERLLALVGVFAAGMKSGHPADGASDLEEALAIARELADPRSEAEVLRGLSIVRSTQGETGEALSCARRAAESAERSGVSPLVAQCRHRLGETLVESGDLEGGIRVLSACAEDARKSGVAMTLCISLGALGLAWLRCGDAKAAETCGREALAIAERLGDAALQACAWDLIARSAEARADLGAALAAERSKFEVELAARSAESAARLDRLRAQLESERALREALAKVQALERRLQAENEYLREEVVATGGFQEIVGRSAALRRVLHQIAQVAPTDASVLVLGETGVGKELVAHAIHAKSARKGGPLVTVNCAALPAALIESELFGHERGAFTGALARKVGRFELADGGTIFLDEIGELPLDLQAKLLRVLQEGQFERLGESRTRTTDVRVIAATNRDLAALAREGRFRADLYYRLAVFEIRVPPLRERREDVPLLAGYFLSRYRAQLNRPIERISEPTTRALVAYDWPGNIRELANVIQRAVILSPGDTLVLDGAIGFPDGGADAASADESLDAAERAHIRRVLAACGGRVKGAGNAAERLGVPPSTLRSRMKKLGIRPGADA